jgi:hypothetical protein
LKSGSTMRRSRPVPSVKKAPREAKGNDAPVLIVPEQSPEAIRLRREIREAFHDSKARTVTAPRRRG